METKIKSNQEMEHIIENMLFWVIMLFVVIIEYDHLNFNSPLMCAFYFTSILTTILCIFHVNLPIGAKKHTKRWFIPTNSATNNSNLQQQIKEQNKGAVKIAFIWIIFLIIEGLSLQFNIITEKFVILGLIILRIADKLFILIWCPFGAIMNNKCCTTCRIYGWDQLMLNSPLVFFPSVYSYSLLVLSLIPFIEWEMAIKKHPERFSQSTNSAIKCKSCTCVCGRCKKKYP